MILRNGKCAKAMMALPATFGVLGFRPHTYWTAVVALAGTLQTPTVLERTRFEYAEPEDRFVYHQAANAGSEAAEALIDRAHERCQSSAAAHIALLVERLHGRGVEVSLAATAAAVARLPDELGRILQSHALIHAAEGDFGRDLIAAACHSAGLEVHRFVEREVADLLRDRLGGTGPSIAARMQQMGATLGPPWGEDYRLAAQAAWLLLN